MAVCSRCSRRNVVYCFVTCKSQQEFVHLKAWEILDQLMDMNLQDHIPSEDEMIQLGITFPFTALGDDRVDY